MKFRLSLENTQSTFIKEGHPGGTHLFSAQIKKPSQELPDPSLLQKISSSPSDTMFAGAPGHGGVQGRPMRKLDHCCRSRTPTTTTTTSSCRHSRSRRHRRRRCRSTRKPDRYCRSGFLFLELHHPIRRTKASSTRSTNWISAVCSSSSFSTVLFCLGSEERRK
jgi:hypothetical protein